MHRAFAFQSLLANPYPKHKGVSQIENWGDEDAKKSKTLVLDWHNAKEDERKKASNRPTLDIDIGRNLSPNLKGKSTDFEERDRFIAVLETTSANWANWNSNGAAATQRQIVTDFMDPISHGITWTKKQLQHPYVNHMRYQLWRGIQDSLHDPLWTWWDGVEYKPDTKVKVTYSSDSMATVLLDSNIVDFEKYRQESMKELIDLLSRDSLLGINYAMVTSARFGRGSTPPSGLFRSALLVEGKCSTGLPGSCAAQSSMKALEKACSAADC